MIHEIMKRIATQGLQFIAIAAGEADCERVISRTRFISDPKRGKEKDEFTVARIIVGITKSINKEVRKTIMEKE